MRSNYFWRDWPASEKGLYLVSLGVLTLAILFFTMAYFNGASLIIEWLHQTGLKTVTILFDHYNVGLYDFPLKVESLAITQSFMPSDLLIHDWPAMILVVILALGFTILITLITTLNRFWYLIGMGLFTGILIFFKLDMLHFFGSYNKAGLIAALILFYPASYYFHFSAPGSSLVKRLFIFLIAMILFGLFIWIFADVNHKVLYLVNYGIYIPLALTILFIFIVGHEIISSLLTSISSTGNTKGKNHLFHFIFLSLLYLVNISLVYLRNSRRVDLDIYIIDSFWLLLISAIAGIRGYRNRESSYTGIFPFRPIGALLYLTLATISFTTIAYFFLMGNDSFVEVIEDAIVFSQLGYSLIFVIYVFANFFQLLHQNIGMAKVMYKPKYMPYFTARLAGFIVVLALFLQTGKIPYYQSIAGYHSGIGDIYYANNDASAAKEYYKLANNFSSTSHRANFALASIAKNEGNVSTTLNYLLNSVKKNPTDYAYAGIADIYSSRNKYFDALFTLQNGIATFPESGPINNNLGLTFAETDIIDSTLYFLMQAQNQSTSHDIAETNLLAVFASENLPIRDDSLQSLAKKTNYLPIANNLQVLAGLRQTKVEDRFSIKFQLGDKNETEQILYNYNKLLTHPELLDTGYWNRLNTYYGASDDFWMQEQLTFAGALAAFAIGEKTIAFNIFNSLLGQTDSKKALYNGYIGRMALASDAPYLAAQYFEQAIANGNRGVYQEYAFSLMESGQYLKALDVWTKLSPGRDPDLTNLANGMKKVISAKTVKEMLNQDPLSKYNFIRYRSGEFDETLINGFILSMEDNSIQAACWLDLAYKHLKKGNTNNVAEHLQKLESTSFNNAYLQKSYLKFKILFNIQTGQTENLQTLTDTDMHEKDLKPYKELAEAWLLAHKDANDTSDNLFKLLGYRDPFFEPAVLEAVKYFNNTKGDDQTAYNILLNAANINIYSVEIQKAYIMQCLRIGMNQYADEAMNSLKLFAPEDDYKAFVPVYNAMKSKALEKSETW